MSNPESADAAVPASLKKGPAAVAKRTVSALAAAAAVTALFLHAPVMAFPPVLALCAVLCQAEFCAMAARKVPGVSAARGCAAAILSWLIAPAFLLRGAGPLVPAFAAPAAAAAILLALSAFKPGNMRAALVEAAGLAYICIPVSFFMLLAVPGACGCAGPRYGVQLLFFVLATVKASDMGGYAFGKAFGRHKLCPSVSPNKSWEGLFGGMFGSALVACIFCACAADMRGADGACHRLFWDWLTYPRAALAGAALCLLGTAGDLFESKIKRICGVKDSSAFLPAGMGGFLDMFDSIMFAPAAFYAFCALNGLL